MHRDIARLLVLLVVVRVLSIVGSPAHAPSPTPAHRDVNRLLRHHITRRKLLRDPVVMPCFIPTVIEDRRMIQVKSRRPTLAAGGRWTSRQAVPVLSRSSRAPGGTAGGPAGLPVLSGGPPAAGGSGMQALCARLSRLTRRRPTSPRPPTLHEPRLKPGSHCRSCPPAERRTERKRTRDKGQSRQYDKNNPLRGRSAGPLPSCGTLAV